jgi:hypothetical protein
MDVMNQLDPQHSLFDSVEQMLEPEVLTGLYSQPVQIVNIQPINGHSGFAGGHLSYVNTDAGRFVLKQMSITSDWVMFASDDQHCRAITLWQYGLLDRLRPKLEHKIIACARDGDGWAILMEDLTGHFIGFDRPMEAKLVPVFLDVVAFIHATYWNDPRLKEPCLGLCDPGQSINSSSPSMAEKYRHLPMGVVPEWVRVGWEVMEALLERDVFEQLFTLINNPGPLLDALARYPYTLLHGDLNPANLGHHKQPVAIDWQSATCSLMTIDLAWFIKFGRETMEHTQAVNYYRNRLEIHLNQQIDDTIWQAMLDLGYLVDSLRTTFAPAYMYKLDSNNPERQAIHEKVIKNCNQHVRDAMRWL